MLSSATFLRAASAMSPTHPKVEAGPSESSGVTSPQLGRLGPRHFAECPLYDLKAVPPVKPCQRSTITSQ